MAAKKKTVKNSVKSKNPQAPVQNSLSESIMGFNPTGMPTTELSQADTLFKNNRWYLVSNMRQLLSQIYVEHGLVQTVVDVPVDDGLRGGVEIITKELSEEEIDELQTAIEQDDILGTVGQAIKWNRLFGGAGVMVITDQDPETELDLDAIGEDSDLEFRAVDMWELFWDKQSTEGFDVEIQEEVFSHYSYYGKKVHKSRVFKLKGLTPPSFVRPRLRGWGFSIVESLVRSINQYLKANDLTFEVLDEFKIDYYKIKNLTNTLLSPNGAQKVKERIGLANYQKNYQNAVTMDSEDDFQQKQLTFAGISETMVGIRMQIASDLRMPLTKVFGISASGFSSGEDDIENYNAMVESTVRAKIKFTILQVIKIKCQQLFGYVPDDLKITFKPLRVLSSEQEENVKTQKYNRLLQALEKGALTPKEFKEACNKDKLLSVQLDTSVEMLTPPAQANDAANAEDSKASAPRSTTQTPDAPAAKNSLGFDKASYEAAGGDEMFDPAKEYTLSNPRHLDKALWERAEEASRDAFGKIKWQFRAWFYKEHGGKF